MKVRIACGLEGLSRRATHVLAPAHRTVSKYLAVTPVLVDLKTAKFSRNNFALTHVPSGRSIMSGLKSVQAGQVIAGALAAIPLPWAKLTQRNAESYQRSLDAHAQQIFKLILNAAQVERITFKKVKARRVKAKRRAA